MHYWCTWVCALDFTLVNTFDWPSGDQITVIFHCLHTLDLLHILHSGRLDWKDVTEDIRLEVFSAFSLSSAVSWHSFGKSKHRHSLVVRIQKNCSVKHSNRLVTTERTPWAAGISTTTASIVYLNSGGLQEGRKISIYLHSEYSLGIWAYLKLFIQNAWMLCHNICRIFDCNRDTGVKDAIQMLTRDHSVGRLSTEDMVRLLLII